MGRNGQVAWHDILRLANCATPLFATFLSFCWLCSPPPPLVVGIDIFFQPPLSHKLAFFLFFPHALWVGFLYSGDVVLLSARQLKRKRRKKNILLRHTHTPTEWSALSLGLFALETHFHAALVLKRTEWCAEAVVCSPASRPGTVADNRNWKK